MKICNKIKYSGSTGTFCKTIAGIFFLEIQEKLIWNGCKENSVVVWFTKFIQLVFRSLKLFQFLKATACSTQFLNTYISTIATKLKHSWTLSHLEYFDLYLQRNTCARLARAARGIRLPCQSAEVYILLAKHVSTNWQISTLSTIFYSTDPSSLRRTRVSPKKWLRRLDRGNLVCTLKYLINSEYVWNLTLQYQ